MKTKFIKVSTADRLPVISKQYTTNIGFLKFDSFTKVFYKTGHHNPTVEYWLEERPDYEEEMKEMLERIVKTFETDYVVDGEIVDNPYEWLQDVYKETKSILTKLKTES